VRATPNKNNRKIYARVGERVSPSKSKKSQLMRRISRGILLILIYQSFPEITISIK
jgi:hypothetical protein